MIDILLASYNGEMFIAEQIDSIISQSFTDWRLFIQDDCSKDNTAGITQEYAKKYPGKITAVTRDYPSGSAKNNFFSMLNLSAAQYIMFCDQDDVWLPHKIQAAYSQIKKLEGLYGHETPLLVHTDLKIVDENLKLLHQSFFKYQGLNPMIKKLNGLLAQNNITGCTMMINRALFQLVTDNLGENDGILMHDWWIGLIAASFGHIDFCKEPSVLYRQHERNQLGAVNNRSVKGALKIIRERLKSKRRISATYAQASRFYEMYESILPDDKKNTIKTYLSIPERNKVLRIYCLIKNGFIKQNFLTALGQLIFC